MPNNKNTVAIITVFLFCWIFFIFLTQGIDFFWEESGWKVNQDIKLPSVKILTSRLFSPNTLHSIKYAERPFQGITWIGMPKLLGLNVAKHRIVKSLVPALLSTIIFIMLRTQGHTFLGLSAALFFISFTEIFISTLYSQDSMLYMHLFTVSALLLFFFFYQHEKSSVSQYLIGFSILILSRISLLIKHEGRIVLPIILLFALLCRRDLFRNKSFWFLIAIMSIGTLPVLCINEEQCVELGAVQLDKNSHWNIISNFFTRFYTVFYIIKWPALLLLLITLPLTVLSKYSSEKNSDTHHINLAMFSFIWLFAELTLVYAAKSFVFKLYEGATFQRLDFVIIVFPLTLLVFSSFVAAKNALVKYNKTKFLFSILAYCLILLSIFLHGIDLNAWRGGWGDFLIGWQTVRDYMDEHTQNSVLVEPYNHGYPFFFKSNNTAVMLPQGPGLTNYTALLNFSKRFNEVYVGNRWKLDEKKYLKLEAELPVKQTSFYYKLKKTLGRKSKTKFYIYKFAPPNKH